MGLLLWGKYYQDNKSISHLFPLILSQFSSFDKVLVPILIACLFFIFRANISRTVNTLNRLIKSFLSYLKILNIFIIFFFSDYSRWIIYQFANQNLSSSTFNPHRYLYYAYDKLLDTKKRLKSKLPHWRCCSHAK